MKTRMERTVVKNSVQRMIMVKKRVERTAVKKRV